MAAPVLEDNCYGITEGGFAPGGFVHPQPGFVETNYRRAGQMALKSFIAKLAQMGSTQGSGILSKFYAPNEPPKVEEFEIALEVLGPDEGVLEFVTYLDEIARTEGVPSLRAWLVEASRAQLSEDLRIAALAALFPVKEILPEYVEFLESSRRQLRESLDEVTVSKLLRAYE